MLNQQIPTKKEPSEGDSLQVNSIFHTIQGEGPFAGAPAVFIRLAHCNLQCPGCDTEYTKSTALNIPSILDYVVTTRSPKTKLIVITGGEPFRQSIGKLVMALYMEGYMVQIETNGTLAPDRHFPKDGNMVTVICSPKTGSVNKKLEPMIAAYKYVLNHNSVSGDDGLPLTALDLKSTKCLARAPEGSVIYLQPMDCQDEKINAKNMKACVDSCLKFGYIMQVQIHKIINVE